MVSRRRFLTLAGAMAAPAVTIAQEPGRGTLPARTRFRIAYLAVEHQASGHGLLDALRDGMRELGYVEGRNLVIDAYWGENSEERLERHAAEAVRIRPDVIVTQTRAVFFARKFAGTIPVVFGFSGDPVLAKLVESLSRPGSNATGMSMMSLDLVGKRLELIKEIIPRLRRVAVIYSPGHPGAQVEQSTSLASAEKLGLTLQFFPTRNAAELESSLAGIAKTRSEAIMVFPDSGVIGYSERIATFGMKTGIPAISGWAPFAERGNLVAYGPDLRAAFRRLAVYVDKILKGASPAALPVELPTKFELVINMKTANALGLAVPQGVILRADRVIE